MSGRQTEIAMKCKRVGGTEKGDEETSDLVNHAYMYMKREFRPRRECDGFDTLGFHHDNKMTLFRIIYE